MEHNLDDSLNLESAMGVDFEHSEDNVVTQDDITLDTSTDEGGIAMEFENIEEQPMLMDTASEEIIDFMGDQFTLQEYSVPDNQYSESHNASIDNDNCISTSQSEVVGLQYEQQPISVPAKVETNNAPQTFPKIINVKSAPTVRPIAPKKETMVLTKSLAPRQVAIAPKPSLQVGKNFVNFMSKHLAIAPKPAKTVNLGNTSKPTITVVKKVPVSLAHDVSKGNAVLAQIGKQIVMVPAGAGQKIKLVSAGSGAMRLVSANDGEQSAVTQSGKMVTKVFVQGSNSNDLSNQPAVITKLVPATSSVSGTIAGGPQAGARYLTMQQKTVPVSIANNKVIVSSPSKFGKKPQQVISIKSPQPKLIPSCVPMPHGCFPVPVTTPKKVVISANSGQNVVLKTATPKTGQVTKQTGQKAQLHQINVPGKGIQYIRLVTNPPAPAAANKHKVLKTQATLQPTKTYVLADNQGNLIQMTGDKLMKAPPPLVVTSSGPTTRVSSQPQQKLVRIAPVTAKPSQSSMQHSRGQSLLAPLSPIKVEPQVLMEDSEVVEEMMSTAEVELEHEVDDDVHQPIEIEVDKFKHEEVDSKVALRALIADAVGDDTSQHNPQHTPQHNEQYHTGHTPERIDIEFEQDESQLDDSSRQVSESQSHPLIVVPSYMKQDMNRTEYDEQEDSYEESRRDDINVDIMPYKGYLSPNERLLSENDVDMSSSDLGGRMRKACNCTKSQCLKLYCDCFASGEFCHRCNCTNCHNNLDNEELRQKAIRGCLDRNPNAFRPKIGKTKVGGPEIVRRHNKGCNCKRSGCLKNYCECYEAKIACTSICKCVGCRNVEETLERSRTRRIAAKTPRHVPPPPVKQPCSFMTTEVIEAVCQCMLAAAVEGATTNTSTDATDDGTDTGSDAIRDVLEEFARCLHDIIGASHHAPLPHEPQHV